MITFLFATLFLTVPFIFLPFTSELFEFNKIILLYIFTILIVGFWVGKSITNNKFIFKKTILDISLILFLTSQTISAIISIDQITSFFGYYGRWNGGLLSTLSFCLLYWAFVSNINKKQVLHLIKLILFSTLIISIWAILEKYGHSFSCLILNGEFNVSCWAQDVSDRVFASLGQPNWLAAWLVSVAPLTWIALFNSKNKKYISHILSLLIFVSLLFTKSRAGLLGSWVAYTTFWTLTFIKIRKAALTTFLLCSFYLIMATAIFGTPWTEPLFDAPSTTIRQNDTGKIRLIVWKGAIDIWRHNPLLGTGVETFAYSYYKFRPIEHNSTSEWDFVYNKAHNEFLNLAANSGTFGLGAYLLIIITFIYWSVKKILASTTNSIIYISLLAGFIGLNVTSFFGFLTVNTSLMFFIIPAIAMSVKNSKISKNNRKKLYLKNKILLILTVSLMIFLLFQITKLWVADIYFNKGKISNQQFSYNSGLTNLEKAILLAPHFANFHDETAQSYAGLGDTNSSVVHLNIAQKLSTKNIILSKSRASTLVELSQIDKKYFEEAINTLSQLTVDAPTDPQVFYMLGLVYATQGNSQKALAYLNAALTLKPDYQKAVEAISLLRYN